MGFLWGGLCRGFLTVVVLAGSSVGACEVAALQSRAAAGRLRVALFPTAVSSAKAVPAGLSAIWSCCRVPDRRGREQVPGIVLGGLGAGPLGW